MAKTATPATPLPPALRTRLDAAVRASSRKAASPGAVIAVQTPQGRWTKAIGYADPTTKSPMTPDIFQRIGSVTKTYTGALVMQLVGEGKVHLSDRIDQYVADRTAFQWWARVLVVQFGVASVVDGQARPSATQSEAPCSSSASQD